MPAPNVAALDLLRMTVQWQLEDQAGEMTFGYQAASPVGASLSMQDATEQWLLIWGSVAGLATMSPQVLLAGAFGDRFDPVTGRVNASGKAVDGLHFGTSVASNTARQVSDVIKKVTGFAGPRNRGRVFWPFLVVGDLNNDGNINHLRSDARVTFLNTSLLSCALNVGANGITLNLGLLHFAHTTPNPSPPPANLPGPVSYQSVVNFEATYKSGTQRRRSQYGRLNRLS